MTDVLFIAPKLTEAKATTAKKAGAGASPTKTTRRAAVAEDDDTVGHRSHQGGQDHARTSGCAIGLAGSPAGGGLKGGRTRIESLEGMFEPDRAVASRGRGAATARRRQVLEAGHP